MVFLELYNDASYFLIIFVLSFLITILSTLIYGYVTDQSLIRRVKSDIKKIREKQKKAKSDHKKFMKLQQEMMDKNMIIMKQSFKPIIYTFIPLILVFGWMQANLAFVPIGVGEEFNVEVLFNEEFNSVSDVDVRLPESLDFVGDSRMMEGSNVLRFKLVGSETGSFNFVVAHSDFEVSKNVIISAGKDYSDPVSTYGGEVRSITVSHDPVKPLGSTSILGWNPGWLGTYIILSVFFSLISRKLLGIN